MKKQILLLSLAVAGAMAFSQTPSFAQMKVTHKYPLSGDGGYDYLTSGNGNKLYVAHGDKVNIMDKLTGEELGTIDGLSGVHGIALDYATGKGFISNGTANKVSVFNLKTEKIIASIPTEKNPDAIFFEPFSKKIVVGNGKSSSLSFIDPVSNKVVRTIDLGGKPETAVSDKKGTVYVNLEDKSEIVAVDLKTFSIVKRISLANFGEEPSGLAIDTKNKLLFAGCGNKKLVVVDYAKGKILNSYDIGDHCDGVAFNPVTGTVFSSNGEGTLTILKEGKVPSQLSVTSLDTQKGAKTLAVEEKSNTVYLSVAEFSDQKDANGKFIPVHGTFNVLVVQ